jgi:hypothetical protein
MGSYRLGCRCGAAVEIGPGLAGGQVDCPGCGDSLEVPSLRELSRLPRAAPAARPKTTWTLGHALAAGGAVTALLSWAVAGFLVLVSPATPSSEMIRRAVRSAPLEDLLKAREFFSTSGVDRGITLEEARVQLFNTRRRGVAIALGTLGGVGAAVALGGLVLAARGSRPRST